jgi:hypothetical protein
MDHADFTHPNNAGTTIDCQTLSGTFVVLQQKFNFVHGKITTDEFSIGNLTFTYSIVRDPFTRVGSLKTSDGKNYIIISTGNGNANNYYFEDCYLPIMNETAALSDPNGKGLGLTAAKLTTKLNAYWKKKYDFTYIRMIDEAKAILSSAQHREAIIEKIRDAHKNKTR